MLIIEQDDMRELTREECDELNERLCPLSHVAVDEVKLVEQQMRRLFPERYQSKFLYHFTNPDVVGIWLDEYAADFRCTYYQKLNDRLEWLNGIEYVSEYVREYGYDSLADAIESLPEKEGCAPWICCFSENDDSAAMWGMYGGRKTGGFAVGFDKDVLLQLVDAKNSKEKAASSCSDYWLLPCVYLGDSRLNKIIDFILHDAHADEDEHLFREGCEDEVFTRQISRLFFLTLNIKDASFDYEREWRLVTRRRFEDPAVGDFSGIKCDGKAYVNPGVFDRPLREYIANVVVSPCGSDGKLHDYAKLNYNAVCSLKDRYKLSFDIHRSRSPYRGS